MTIKKRLSTLLATILLVMSPVDIEAAVVNPGNEIMPYWLYMNGISIGLHFNGSEGCGDITVMPIPNVTTFIEASLSVYRRTGGDWTLVASTTGSNSDVLCLDVEFNAVAGQTYKAEATVTAYGANGSETDTVSRQDNCPKAEDS